MGREIRRVPANWEHPKSERQNGRIDYRPMFDRPYLEALDEWLQEHHQWEDGTHTAFAEHGYTKAEYPHYANYGGNPPDVEYFRPNWTPEEMIWWQVYETVSEGTPVTPPFATREELVDYLVANGDFWDQSRRKDGRSLIECGPWPRKQAESFVFGSGWAPSLIVTTEHGVQTGVEALNR